jgi:hypothetical protein
MGEADEGTTTHSAAVHSAALQNMAAYAEFKRAALGALTGRVLEIGAGRGANFGYPRGAVDWICLEPSSPAIRACVPRRPGTDAR